MKHIFMSCRVFVFSLLFISATAQAELCTESSSLSTAADNVISILGTVPKDLESTIISQIQDAGNGAQALSHFNDICVAIKNKDAISAMFMIINKIAEITDDSFAPFVAVQTDLAKAEIDAIKNIATFVSFQNLQAPEGIKFILDLQTYHFWGLFNTSMSTSQVSDNIASMDLVYTDGNSSSLWSIATDPSDATYQTAAISNEQASPAGTKPFVQVVFKNSQKFLIPLASGSVDSPSAFSFSLPFVFKDGVWRYNK